MLDTTPTAKLARLLDAFDAALAAGDIGRAVDQFEDDCYWRDLVALTWNIKTLEGKDEIRAMLESQLPRVAPTGFAPAEGEEASEANGLIEGWLRFETGAARGYGHIRVRNGKIWTLLTTMVELKGFEEKAGFARPFGAKHGADKNRRTWKEEREQEAAELGYQPSAVYADRRRRPGRNCARRAAAQLDVPTIIVDKQCAAGRCLAQALQIALPARPGLVRPSALHRLPQELAGVLAEGQDRRLAGDVRQGDGAELLGLDTCQERQL